MKRPVALLLGFAALATGAIAVAQAEDALLKRYPYDPACAWGRVGNGKGMVVRCISEDEAKAIRNAPAAALPAGKPSAATPATSVASTKPSEAAPAPTPAPASTSETAPGTSSEEPRASGDENAPLEVVVGPVAAEEGTLGVGKLGMPKDRYQACVQKNGGLSGKTGEVSVRFLVRAKGVAEGPEVTKRQNLSKEAAACIADVIDRRRVGTPAAPEVGATVVVKFTRLDKPAK